MLVGLERGAYWAKVLLDARLHEVPGAGHLLPLLAWADVLDGFKQNQL